MHVFPVTHVFLSVSFLLFVLYASVRYIIIGRWGAYILCQPPFVIIFHNSSHTTGEREHSFWQWVYIFGNKTDRIEDEVQILFVSYNCAFLVQWNSLIVLSLCRLLLFQQFVCSIRTVFLSVCLSPLRSPLSIILSSSRSVLIGREEILSTSFFFSFSPRTMF